MTEKTTEERIAELEARIDTTDNKNKELLGKLKDRDSKLEAANAKITELTDAADTAAEQLSQTSTNAEAIKAHYEKFYKDKYEKVNGELATELKTLKEASETNTRTTAVKDAIIAANIAPAFRDTVMDAWLAKAKLVEGVTYIGETPLEEFSSAFVASDSGKAMIAATSSSGAGARSSTTAQSAGLPEKWNYTTYSKMRKENPTEAEAYKTRHNISFD